jgi:hypothetical protein
MKVQTHRLTSLPLGDAREADAYGVEPTVEIRIDRTVEIPIDRTAVTRAVEAVTLLRRENIVVHGLSCGLRAFASILAHMLTERTRQDPDTVHLSGYGCTDTPTFHGLPLFLDLAAEPTRVAALAAFQVATMRPDKRQQLANDLARVELEPHHHANEYEVADCDWCRPLPRR